MIATRRGGATGIGEGSKVVFAQAILGSIADSVDVNRIVCDGEEDAINDSPFPVD